MSDRRSYDPFRPQAPWQSQPSELLWTVRKWTDTQIAELRRHEGGVERSSRGTASGIRGAGSGTYFVRTRARNACGVSDLRTRSSSCDSATPGLQRDEI